MKRKNGFTLIEILVVIGIIGLLAVFMVPNLLGAQDRAKEAAVKSVMHSIQLAIEAYNMENYTYPIAKTIDLKNLVVNYLSAGGYMIEVPKNPFTGKPYIESDVAGRVIYDYNTVSGKYTLTGYKRNGETQILTLSNM